MLVPPVAFALTVGIALLFTNSPRFVWIPMALLLVGAPCVGVASSIKVARRLGGRNKSQTFLIGGLECLVVLVLYGCLLVRVAASIP